MTWRKFHSKSRMKSISEKSENTSSSTAWGLIFEKYANSIGIKLTLILMVAMDPGDVSLS